ncbi:MAG: hypothetical protein LBS00_13355 [Synergistaceae bacterium]|nr:hypothetical protein [Synergistaceae bacterium]
MIAENTVKDAIMDTMKDAVSDTAWIAGFAMCEKAGIMRATACICTCCTCMEDVDVYPAMCGNDGKKQMRFDDNRFPKQEGAGYFILNNGGRSTWQ